MRTESLVSTSTYPKTIVDLRKTGSCLTLLLFVALGVGTAANAQVNYATNGDGTVSVVGSCVEGNLAIPSLAMGMPVTAIGVNAFRYCPILTGVSIPDSVRSIGPGAFYACSELTNASLGDGVTRVGNQAFAGCKLTSIQWGRSVTDLDDSAFESCSRLPSIIIPNSILSLGVRAFAGCSALTNVVIGDRVPMIKQAMFQGCSGITQLKIGASVTNVWDWSFHLCTGLNTVTFPRSVTYIGEAAFGGCTGLTNIFFLGDAPTVHQYAFSVGKATVYYLPGTSGWGPTLGGVPTALWNPQVQTTGANFGVLAGQFGFNITGSSNLVVVVEACANLTNPVWTPVGTNTLTTGSSYFSDPQWTNYSARLYRLRSP